ncbi:lytic transglycosylase [Paludibacterium yongneupense]|uniref:lytic transglycosylase n=1 Tax=Paludibacterium yongneupense TaxID=400061 RepID=UPI000427CFB5|nr:LysM peptidoglycan-binding domain-containing protein [Paludibacterium yongneupense]
MNRIKPLALSLLFFAATQAFADATPASAQGSVNEPVAAGLDMMLLNSSLLRNGDSVWQRVREGFQLSEVNTDLVRRQERFYASHPELFKRTLDRSRKYLFHIMNEVERRGMPTEIALLPMVESSFVPTAQSRVGASGLWQFMPMTGRRYGLEQTWWYDGRRDVVEATRAALDYLQALYTQFGDWNLALAAYNWGEGNLARAIGKLQGGDVNYENIRMPLETRNYVPKLLALRNLLATPDKFGIHLDKFPNKPYFVAVSPGRHMDIDIAAHLAGMSVSEFKDLNPAFNLPVFAYKNGRQMLIPASRIDRFEASLAHWDKPLLTWQVYTPQNGETANDVAMHNGMSTAQLMSANHLGSTQLQVGRPLLVAMHGNGSAAPLVADAVALSDTGSSVAETRPAAVATASAAPVTPVPAAVETVASAPAPVIRLAQADAIAQIAQVTEAAPAARIEPAAAPATESHALAETQRAPQATARLSEIPAPVKAVALLSGSSYTVKAGDTLYNISRRTELSVAELKELNKLGSDSVKLGQVLKIKGRNIATAIAQNGAQGSTEPLVKTANAKTAASNVPVEYVVQRGDTVFSIARRFGVNHTDIQRWNDASRLATLQPGQKVIVEGL